MSIKNIVIAFILAIGITPVIHAHGGHTDSFASKTNHGIDSAKKIIISPEGKKAINVKSESVQKSFLDKYIDLTGEVSVSNNNHSDISLAISGLVKEVLVEEGDQVTKGQVLAVIQSLEATQVLKNLLSQKNDVEKEILILANDLEVKKSTYTREKALVEEGISPRKDLYEAQSLYEAAQASLAARKKELGFVISASKSELSIMGLPQDIIEQSINSGYINPNIKIFSPLSGVVSMRNVNPGEAINSSQKILSIDNLKPIWVNVDVYQEQIPLIKLGQKVKIKSSSGEEIEGKIENIGSNFSSSTRTLHVRIVCQNENETLKPGMMVSARVIVDKSEVEALVIPANAVIKDQDKSLIYRDHHGEYYQAVEIKTGFEDSSQVEVLEGLHEGDLIVTHGVEQIHSEALLKTNQSDEDHGHKNTAGTEIPWILILSILGSSLITFLACLIFFKTKGSK
jgi:multidrug efflux pump subunit AcrA (membrane-fusion protein)